jgi:hypothetical protein
VDYAYGTVGPNTVSSILSTAFSLPVVRYWGYGMMKRGKSDIEKYRLVLSTAVLLLFYHRHLQALATIHANMHTRTVQYNIIPSHTFDRPPKQNKTKQNKTNITAAGNTNETNTHEQTES